MYQNDVELLESVLDGTSEPKKLSLSFLEHITNNFSKEREIAGGGFGVVYMGKFNNTNVAVKKLRFTDSMEMEFDREMENLLSVKHQNVVRLLGYCNNRIGEYLNFAKPGQPEKFKSVHTEERIMCFEYITNGSLTGHIDDELRGLEWHARYKIIKEICQALLYLHDEKNLVHRDLKPDNILMDDNLVPKIADLGISKLLDKGATRAMTARPCGTETYIAPEYEDGQVSFKHDIYSLGVIITQIVTGFPKSPDPKIVLTRWRYRWNKSIETLRYQQVAKCIQIGLSCKDEIPRKRPSIAKIIKDLDDVDCGNGAVGKIIPCWNDLLWIEPPELFFPFEINKKMSCTLELHNETDACMAFSITPHGDMQTDMDPQKGILQPGLHLSVSITLVVPAGTQMFNAGDFTIRSTKVNEGLTAGEITKETFKVENVEKVRIGVVFYAKKRQRASKAEPKQHLSLESGETSFAAKYGTPSVHDLDKKSSSTNTMSGGGLLDVVIVYAFDCTTSSPAWNKVDSEIFWLVQEKLKQFKGSCMGYTYVMSTPNTCTSDMKLVDSMESKETGYKGSSAWSRTACAKNMACGLLEAHKLISYRGHWNSIILLFSDGLINKGDFFDGAQNFKSKVPVHTFTLGEDAYNQCLRDIAANSPGGTFSPLAVPDKPSLSIPFSQVIDSVLNGTKHPNNNSGRCPLDVVIVYAFDCTNVTPAWDKVDSEIFWLVQEKLKHFKDSCMGYTYVMSTPNNCTSDMKLVNSEESKATGYKGSSLWSRTACTRNMSSGLPVAHRLIRDHGHLNGIILLFSDGMINQGDFFDGAENFISKVPVHTFTLGGNANNHVLRAMAANSPGGRFNPIPVPEKPMLSIPFSHLLDSILNETTKENL